MIAVWLLVGLVVGWGGGRLLVLNGRHGVPGDVAAGVLGSVLAASAITAAQVGVAGDALNAVLGGVAGALAATFVRRAFSDRYRRAHA